MEAQNSQTHIPIPTFHPNPVDHASHVPIPVDALRRSHRRRRREQSSSTRKTKIIKEEEETSPKKEEEEEEEDKEEIERKIEALQRIVPSGESLGMDMLFDQTAGYIMALQYQVKGLRALSCFFERLEKEKAKLGG